MKVEKGNLWEKHQQGYHIVIPLSTKLVQGQMVMTSGLADEARLQFPLLPQAWARPPISRYVPNLRVASRQRLFGLAVKHDWRDKPDPVVILVGWRSLLDLVSAMVSNQCSDTPMFPIYLPKLGCGGGRLKWEDVHAMLQTTVHAAYTRQFADKFVFLE